MLGGNESTIYGIENFTIGSGAVSYKIDKYTEATDNLVVKVGNVTVATRNNVSGTSSNTVTRSITFTTDELNAIFDAMSKVSKATFLFTITSYVDGAKLGSTSATAIGTLPSAMKPALTKVNLVENVSGIASKFGGFVKNKSKLDYSFTFTLAKGSTISSYNLTIDGSTYTGSKGTTNTLKSNGSISYSAYVVDSRGRKSNTLEGVITILDYNNPQIPTFNVVRCDAQGNETNEGLYVKYTIVASISSVNNKNDKSFIIDYKKQTDSTWTTWKSYTGGYTFKETSPVLEIEEVAYHFRIRANDYFNTDGSINKIYLLSSTYKLFELTQDLDGISWGGSDAEVDTFGIGFGKTKLSKIVYVGGQENPNEKNVYFPNPDDSQYPHNSKVYGGNATSPVSIGMWDSNKGLPIYQYFDGAEYRFKFGDDIVLRWGNYDIEAILEKVSGSLSGRYHTKEGLLVQWGTTSIAGGAGEATSQEIKFPIAYDKYPFVVESLVSTVPGTIVLGSGHGNDALDGTTLYVTRINTANTSLRWLAIGYKEV